VIVLDSSFIVGFYNERDALHNSARTLMERFLNGEWGRGLLLEYVFLEVATVLLIRRDLAVARASAGCYSMPMSWISFRVLISSQTHFN
jgi:predicted nucleic acid-binding protein